MNKLQVIQSHWIDLGFEPSQPDENGWIDYDFLPDGFDIGNLDAINRRSSVTGRMETFVRPKSLRGIENNNGWVKIISENDLPKDNKINYKIYHNLKYPKCSEEFSLNLVLGLYKKEVITHYKPCVVELNPLY